MKAIKIKRCSDQMFWYRDLVGTVVPFLRDAPDFYMSREPAGYSNIVRKTDGEIVEVEKGTKFYVTRTTD